MNHVARFILLLALAAPVLGADRSLDNAWAAQAKLGVEVWSRVLRVDNERRFSPYPKVVYALVFEFGDLLWFYTDTEGTQSFSLHRGRLAEEKADFGPLLHDIEPGFTQWRVLSDGPQKPRARTGELPNGCFINSVVALHERIAQGDVMEDPRLLSFYVVTAAGMRGHTVLTFKSFDGLEVIDASESKLPRVLSRGLNADPLTLAGTLTGDHVVKARWIPAGPVTLPHVVATIAGGGPVDEIGSGARRMLTVR